LLKKKSEYLTKYHDDDDIDELFATEINALVIRDAEEYYRTMLNSGAESWNRRDTHMVNILQMLMQGLEHASNSKEEVKAVVWAHNSHIGDARYTDQSWRRKEINLGQLARERFGYERTFNIGFTTDHGTVTAASNWDSPREIKTVNPSKPNSVERVFYNVAEETGNQNFLLLFNRVSSDAYGKAPVSTDLTSELAREPCLIQRAIGVIYRPDTELQSHYFQAKISNQFDSVIHIDKTSALKPLDKISDFEPLISELPDTFPTGD